MSHELPMMGSYLRVIAQWRGQHVALVHRGWRCKYHCAEVLLRQAVRPEGMIFHYVLVMVTR